MTSATDSPAPASAPVDPRARAQALLEESQQALEEALRQLASGGPTAATGLVGQASDRIGSALYFLRLATRR